MHRDDIDPPLREKKRPAGPALGSDRYKSSSLSDTYDSDEYDYDTPAVAGPSNQYSSKKPYNRNRSSSNFTREGSSA